MFHGWMFDPDGDQAAADSTRSSTTLDTGSSVNPRTARRLVTASYTSMIAYLPPALAMRVRKHSEPNATSLAFISNPLMASGRRADEARSHMTTRAILTRSGHRSGHRSHQYPNPINDQQTSDILLRFRCSRLTAVNKSRAQLH